MNNLKSKLLIPVCIGLLSLTACSQNDSTSVKKGSISTNGTTTQKGTNNGQKTGTVGRGNASSVTSSHKNGSRGQGADGRSQFDYVQGRGINRNDGSDLTLAGLNDPNNLLSQRIIYFDYDKAAIRPEFMVLINTHAKLAAKYPQLRMRLEGHADERGSREYNIALSDNRAKSVKRIMGTQGARSTQIRTIGYGEEVPIVAGQGERSWQKNRRVEIKYDNY